MAVAGIDPSFKDMGISVYYPENKTFLIWRFEKSLGDRVDFTRAWEVSRSLVAEVINYMGKNNWRVIDSVITEIPPPNKLYSMGLAVLDSLLMESISQWVYSIYTVSAAWLTHIHGVRKYTKKDSITLAKHFMEVFQIKGYQFKLDVPKLTDGMAESFLILLKGLVITKVSEELRSLILNELQAYGTEEDYKKVWGCEFGRRRI